MDVDTFQTLLAPSGQALLAEVHQRAGVESDHALGARLRESLDGDLVAAAVTQNHLRGVAVDKYGTDAARMYFTHDSLRVSTSARLADHRAQRLRAAGVTRVVELGCGLGGDLLALARAGLEVRGIDIDPVRVAIARSNLDALGLPGSVEVGDPSDVDIDDGEVVFCVPDRPVGGRATRLDGWSPSWELLSEKLTGRAVLVVNPGMAHSEIPSGVEAEWVAAAGGFVECSLWSNGIVGDTAGRRVTLLPGGDTIVGEGDGVPDANGPVGQFLVEPHDAVVRAGLCVELTTALGGRMLDAQMDWIATDELVDTAFGRSYEVVREVPFRTSKLRIALSDHDIGTATIKSPGLPVVPDALIAKLRLTGTHAATVVLTRVAGTGRAFIVDAVTPD